ncbi:DUF961 family protein [Suipraeoptans intestinalis]|nr:DUF961 family protein [Suipraeoptans intestinalis]
MNNLPKGAVPDMEKSFGVLTFLGSDPEPIRRRNSRGNAVVIGRRYRLLSETQTGEEIEVIVKDSQPKNLMMGDEVILSNPIVDFISVDSQFQNGNRTVQTRFNADQIDLKV